MTLEWEARDKITKVTIQKDLTVAETDNLRTEISKRMELGQYTYVFDFSGCDFIDSTGLDVLISIYKKCREKGGSVSICAISNPKVLKVFKLTRLDKVFNIYSNCRDAMHNNSNQ